MKEGRRSVLDVKLGTTIKKEDYLRLKKISRITGLSVSHLIKQGIWYILRENKLKRSS